jgi:hypothetical protein
MTKLSKKFLLIILTVFVALFATNVYAECTADEKAALIREAQNIRVSYVPHVEICYPGEKCHEDAINSFLGEDGEMHGDAPYGTTSSGEEGYLPYVNDLYLEIDIYNVSQNFYAVVKHNRSSAYSQKIVYSDFKNNKYSFEWDAIDKVGKFSINIYGSAESGCEGVHIRELTLTHPKGNEFYQVSRCEGLEDYFLCQPFINTDVSHLNAAEVWQMVENEKTTRINNKSNSENKNKDNKIEYVYIFAATACGMGLIGAGIIILKRKYR